MSPTPSSISVTSAFLPYPAQNLFMELMALALPSARFITAFGEFVMSGLLPDASGVIDLGDTHPTRR